MAINVWVYKSVVIITIVVLEYIDMKAHPRLCINTHKIKNVIH